MKKVLIRAIAALTVGVMLLTSLSAGASAAVFFAGQSLSFGKVTRAEHSSVVDGVTYDEAYIKNDSDEDQHVRTLTLDTLNSDYVPLVYSKYSGYGATTLDNARAAEAAGYDVVGGINGSFFSLTGTSANIYGGITISDGKVLQGNGSYPVEWVLAINSDGSTALVQSDVSFSFRARDGAVSADIECVNICPDKTYNVIYYFDELCGTKTDTKAAGVEIVFDKLYHTELSVGGSLLGRVAEVRSKVSSGGDIGKGQFVLYAPDGSYYASVLRRLSVGDTAEVTATENVESSRKVMENCSSAVVTYGYTVVKGGKNVTSSNGLGDSFNNQRAQRTGLGIKSDGALVFVTTDGRSEEYAGLTVYELADLLISMGCVTALNLDGGYSTQMVVQDKASSLIAETEQLRRVANSILIVKRTAVTPELKESLRSLIAEAQRLLVGYELGGDVSSLTYEIGRAASLLDVKTVMDGDCIKTIMSLREAMDGVEILAYRAGIYKLASPQHIRLSASSDAVEVREVGAGTTLTVSAVNGDYGYTKYLGFYGYIDLTKAEFAGSSEMKGAVINAPARIYLGDSLRVSWKAVPGASAYSYTVTALARKPGGANETADSTVLAQAWTTVARSIDLPVTSFVGDGYVRIDVTVEYPTGSVTSTVYTEVSFLPFVDVPLSYWGYDGIRYTYEKGLFRGVTDTVFDPSGTMTRAMMATLVYRMAGSPDVSAVAATTFEDVRSGSWYYKGVLWCQAEGIVTGVTDTVFAPDATVTREQAACFLYRFAEYVGADVNISNESVADSFVDSKSIGRYARRAMAWTVESGIMQGSGGRLSPKASADRAQVATLIFKFDSMIDN